MALRFSKTSCIFRQTPLGRMRSRGAERRIRAANDNVFRVSASEATSDDDTPSFVDVALILALMAIFGTSFYLISTVLSGYIKSLPSFYH